MGLTDKQAEAIDKIKQKSDDDYEKNVVYIAAGTLVLSMTFLEKIIKVESSTYIWILIVGWGFLALTLLCNLLSHQLSSLFHERCRDLYEKCEEPGENAAEADVQAYNTSLADANDRFEKYNSIIRYLNWTTTFSLFIGIALLVVFCSANALKANSNKITNNNLIDSIMSKEIKPQTNDLTKGRTISASVKPTSQQSGANNNTSGNQSGSSASNNNQTSSK